MVCNVRHLCQALYREFTVVSHSLRESSRQNILYFSFIVCLFLKFCNGLMSDNLYRTNTKQNISKAK